MGNEMRQGFFRKKKSMEDLIDAKVDALLRDMGLETPDLSIADADELGEFFKDVKIGVADEDGGEFSREWYEAFLDGKISVCLDDTSQTMEDFIAHARKVCGR